MVSGEQLNKPLALNDWAYAVIKDDILKFRSPPGSLLRINDLSEKLNISRTPIREALLRLENEGLVRAENRVGFFVAEITRKDVEELFDLRSLLEGYAAEIATQYLTKEDMALIEVRLSECDLAIEQGHHDEFVEADAFFHSLLIERAPNSHLKSMVALLDGLTYREYHLVLNNPENLKASMNEHWNIFRALRHVDGIQAKRMMRKHLCSVRERLMNMFDSSSKEKENKDEN